MELIEGLEIVGNTPILYLRPYKTLILADTHIGYEEDMAEKGIFIPRFQLRRVLELLENALNEVNVDRVVVAGDIKHRFDGLGRLERKELSELFTYLQSRVNEIVIVRGNHDNYLPILQRKFNFSLVNEYIIDRYLIIHGHRDLKLHERGIEWDILIMGHEHPSITLRDELGIVGKFACYLIGTLRNGKKFIVLPAVGAYQTGSKISLSPETYLSPIIKNEAVIDEMVPIIIDEEVGTFELPKLKYIFDLIT